MHNDQEALLELDNKVKLQNALYNRGVASYTSVITMQIEQLVLQLNLTETKLHQLISLVSLYQNLGGGYKY
jgi:outer membrane protein TolC